MTEQPAQLAFFVDAFEASVRSLLEAVGHLGPQDWDRPTDLPGWSVRDVLGHLAAIESELLGRPVAAPMDSYGDHVRDGFGRHMEDGVQARRRLPVADVVAELAGTLEERVAAMRAMSADDPPVRVPAGREWDTETLLRNRAFDAWTHEQDVRRAVGRPGDLDGPGAQLARLVMTGALPYLLVKRAGAKPGQSVRVEVSGPMSFGLTVEVGPDGRAAVVDGDARVDPTSRVRTDWETFVRLGGGRVAPEDAAVTVEGDPDLARRLLAGMAITP